MMSMTDESLPADLPNRPLRRPDARRYLREKHGIDAAPATLAKKAVTGGGPEYELFGRIPYYCPAKLDQWVLSQLKRRRSSSDRGCRPTQITVGDTERAKQQVGQLTSPL